MNSFPLTILHAIKELNKTINIFIFSNILVGEKYITKHQNYILKQFDFINIVSVNSNEKLNYLSMCDMLISCCNGFTNVIGSSRLIEEYKLCNKPILCTIGKEREKQLGKDYPGFFNCKTCYTVPPIYWRKSYLINPSNYEALYEKYFKYGYDIKEINEIKTIINNEYSLWESQKQELETKRKQELEIKRKQEFEELIYEDNIMEMTDNKLELIYKNINNFYNKYIIKFKKILFICGDYPGYGGAATNCYNLQTFFESKNKITYGFYFNFEDSKNKKYKHFKNYEINNIENISKIKFNPDLIILKSPTNIKYLKTIFNNIPIIYLIGGIYNNSLDINYMLLNTRELQYKYINNRVLYQISLADISFTNSLHTSKILKYFYNINTNVFYSSYVNYFNTKPIIDKNFENRKYEYGLIVSNFDTRPIKNVEKSINFLKDKENVILIGKNSSKYKDLGFECVELVDNKEMQDYYKKIKCIVQDSHYESCSNVMVESLFNGCKHYKTKTILVSSTQYPGYGGGATNAYNIIKYLRTNGFKVAGLFFNKDTNVNYDPDKLGGIFISSYNINYNIVSKINHYCRSPIDICFTKMNKATTVCKKIFNCKIIYLCSGISYFSKSKETAEYVLNNSVEKYNNIDDFKTFDTCYKILCNSNLTIELFKKIYPQYKNKLLNYYIDTSSNINIDILKKEKKYDIVLCCSNYLREQKNMKYVLKLFQDSRWDKYSKVIIGKNSHIFKNINNTDIYDLLSQNECLKIISQSKIVLIPSLFDSNPNVSKEAYYNNCFPIITKNIGCSELFPDCLICKNYDEDIWFEKCSTILDNYEKYKDEIKINFNNSKNLIDIINCNDIIC